jgi:hypothetical protein
LAVLLVIFAFLFALLSYASFDSAARIARTATPNWAVHFCTKSPIYCQYPTEMACVAAALVLSALAITVLALLYTPKDAEITVDRIDNMLRRPPVR